ncbi:MAG: hypothetical protein VX871_01985 [Pseudomonadota bacterium]|nr:hypothetical protein [Pseudomonadota bacterium]
MRWFESSRPSQFSCQFDALSAMAVNNPQFQTVARGMWRGRLIAPQTGAFFAWHFSGALCVAHGSAMSDKGPIPDGPVSTGNVESRDSASDPISAICPSPRQ